MKYPKSLKRNSKKRKTLRRKTIKRRNTRKVAYQAPKENVRTLAKRIVNTYIYRPKK